MTETHSTSHGILNVGRIRSGCCRRHHGGSHCLSRPLREKRVRGWSWFRFPALASSVILALGLGAAARAAEPVRGAAILQDLNGFKTYATVLHVAAHPDDENRTLLAYLSRGRNY